jgi:hypothetical protein
MVGDKKKKLYQMKMWNFCSQVMNVCLRCIWESLPHLVINQLDLTNPLALNQMDLENNCGDRIRFAAKSKITWRERFNRYFPTREDDILLY